MGDCWWVTWSASVTPTSPSRQQENKLICVYAIPLFIRSGIPNTFREKTVEKDTWITFLRWRLCLWLPGAIQEVIVLSFNYSTIARARYNPLQSWLGKLFRDRIFKSRTFWCVKKLSFININCCSRQRTDFVLSSLQNPPSLGPNATVWCYQPCLNFFFYL